MIKFPPWWWQIKTFRTQCFGILILKQFGHHNLVNKKLKSTFCSLVSLYQQNAESGCLKCYKESKEEITVT